MGPARSEQEKSQGQSVVELMIGFCLLSPANVFVGQGNHLPSFKFKSNLPQNGFTLVFPYSQRKEIHPPKSLSEFTVKNQILQVAK